ncbi:MAG: hypothetical protein K0S82_1782 [Gaiellaceae bacterium]|nr:hypothetical protein [Gaiellaceae bacterium]
MRDHPADLARLERAAAGAVLPGTTHEARALAMIDERRRLEEDERLERARPPRERALRAQRYWRRHA